jgi:superoxide dismutase
MFCSFHFIVHRIYVDRLCVACRYIAHKDLEKQKIRSRPAKKFNRNASRLPVSREKEDSLTRNESCYRLENRKQNKETSEKLKRDSRSAYDQADAVEENGNQKEDSICTHGIEKYCDDVRGEI